jgi:hypothetical protein
VSPIVPIILGTLGALLSALGAVAVTRRQRSGKIDTTEAETLWAEGQAMRRELRDEAIALRAEVVALRVESVAMRTESAAMRAELVVLREESVSLRQAAADCRDEVVMLKTLLREARAKHE